MGDWETAQALLWLSGSGHGEAELGLPCISNASCVFVFDSFQVSSYVCSAHLPPLFLSLSVNLSICLSVCVSVYLSICLSVYLCLSICLSVGLSRLSLSLSMSLSCSLTSTYHTKHNPHIAVQLPFTQMFGSFCVDKSSQWQACLWTL